MLGPGARCPRTGCSPQSYGQTASAPTHGILWYMLCKVLVQEYMCQDQNSLLEMGILSNLDVSRYS